jgi:hypothetical protein
MRKKYRRAALYALYPNELGLCGPGGRGKGKLYQYLTTKSRVSDSQVRILLEQFTAAAAYLKLIAAANQIDDWLNPRVVDAYWIGNDLLKRVRPEDLKVMILDFVGRGKMARAVAEEVIARTHYRHRPHHSFHVIAIGGVSGQVKRGSIGQELCRIGWGRVASIGQGAELTVVSKSLRQKGGKFFPELEEERERLVRRDTQLFPHLSVGDLVALHWGRVVEKITDDAARRLEYWTERTLRNCKS